MGSSCRVEDKRYEIWKEEHYLIKSNYRVEKKGYLIRPR